MTLVTRKDCSILIRITEYGRVMYIEMVEWSWPWACAGFHYDNPAQAAISNSWGLCLAVTNSELLL